MAHLQRLPNLQRAWRASRSRSHPCCVAACVQLLPSLRLLVPVAPASRLPLLLLLLLPLLLLLLLPPPEA